ncbi:MAG: 4Fe-4S dicluster domain-containing protein [Thermoprotei archaeon]|jgi:ferredoxin
MTSSVVMYDRKLSNLIVALGGNGIRECYQCGSCTAICPISENFSISFRRTIKYAQLGLEKKLVNDLTPWICHACGECSNSCPRDANPSELMMTFRRYLTTKYDWTGLSRLFYFSKKVELFTILILSLLTGVVIYLFHGPIILDSVELDAFAPVSTIEFVGLIILAILALILITNVYRMYRFTVTASMKLPFKTYLTEFIKIVPFNFLTQNLSQYCNDKRYWINHLLIFYGFVVLFVCTLVDFVLRLFQRTDLLFSVVPSLNLNVINMIGIVAGVVLLYGGFTTIYGRVKKSRPIWKSSHITDWTFIIVIVLVVITGLMTVIFKSVGLPLLTYVTYSLHLMLIVPLIILAFFEKGLHLIYRPFALYFARLNELKSKGVGNI